MNSNKVGRPAKVTEDMVMDAVRKLRAAGRDVTIPAVREFVGEEGGNSTISEAIKVCEQKLRAEEAAMRKLTPAQEDMAGRLVRQVISQLYQEVEGESQRAIAAAQAREVAEVEKAQRSAEVAWREVDQRTAERDQARGRVGELEASNEDLRSRADRAEARADQQATEIERLSAAAALALAAERELIATVADLRARLEAKEARESDLIGQIETVKKGGVK